MNFRALGSQGCNTALKWLGAVCLMAATTKSQPIQKVTYADSVGIRFREFLTRVSSEPDSLKRSAIVDDYLFHVRAYGREVIEDSTVYFLYRGNARRVHLASDINGWSPSADSLTRIEKTDFFTLALTMDPRTRFEYKFVVDSVWMLDPINPRTVMGGYGQNSEIWMPRYTPPKEIEYRQSMPHGRLDTLTISSKALMRAHPVIVYTPAIYRRNSRTQYPTIFVTDGGEYVSLGLMTNVLDNMIAEGRVLPVIAVFVDPRTDIRNTQTSKRMQDYSMSDTFVNFLVSEVRGQLLKKYRMKNGPAQTAIMGASLGGLIATYAAYTRPDVFGLCAAQSPAYWWRNKEILTKIEQGEKRKVKFSIDTGTIRDAQEAASEMRDILQRKGYQVRYEEHPEGHNWMNWRARLPSILTYFWGIK